MRRWETGGRGVGACKKLIQEGQRRRSPKMKGIFREFGDFSKSSIGLLMFKKCIRVIVLCGHHGLFNRIDL